MEIPIQNPQNAKNRVFTETDIHTILRRHKCDHQVRNRDLFQRAMIHSSYVKRDKQTTPTGEIAQLAPKPDGVLELFDESYERLEHLGDSILGAAVATYLSIRFPTSQEGFLTNLRKEIVNNASLGQFTLSLGLNEFYIISRHNEDACNGRRNIQKLGDILEAFLGALWIDCDQNFQIFYRFVVSLIETQVDIPKTLLNDSNFKDQLQKQCQTQLHYTPTYAMLEEGENGQVMAVFTDKGVQIGKGVGTTKKAGEQMAAKNALARFKGKRSS